MDDSTLTIPLDGFRVSLVEPNAFALSHAAAQVDGDDWGQLPIDRVQRRLEKLDDFAIVQLTACFPSAGGLQDLTITLDDEGLRNCSLDGTYLVPRREGAPGGTAMYALPDPLPPGGHELVWSYAWNPPADRSTGDPLPGGVTLTPPRIYGTFVNVERCLRPLPEVVDLGRLAAEGLEGCRLELSTTIEVPPGCRTFHVDGPGAGTLEVRLADRTLAAGHGARGLVVPPGMSGRVQLTLVAGPPPPVFRSLRLSP